MKVSLLNIFDLKKESGSKDAPNLTEERIYSYSHYFLNNEERIPVISASIANKGITGYVPDLRNKQQTKEHEQGKIMNVEGISYYKNLLGGCITIVADGVYAGYSFYRNQKNYPLFTINISCLVFFKKSDDEIKKLYPDFNGLNLEWFNLKFHNYLKNVVRGEGVKHFTRTVCKNIDNLEIPKIEEQEKEFNELSQIDKLNKDFNRIKEYIEITLSKEVNGFTAVISDDFEKMFYINKGTGGFTEEAIYHSMPTEGHEQIPVFGGEETHFKPRKYVDENAENKHHKKVNYFSGECLILSMDGSAGCMTYKSEGEKFTLNHHAASLMIKPNYKEKINLKWFKHEYQNTLKDSAVSKGSSRTLSKGVLNSIVITAPNINTQKEWVKEIEELELINKKLQKVQNYILEISKMDIIPNKT